MRRIAIVDDVTDNRLLLRAILGEHYHITEHETGTAALAALQASPPDLVLLTDEQELRDLIASLLAGGAGHA